MNKKTKIIIITVSVFVVVATLIGVMWWGLQPVQEENVSLEKLNKKVGNRFCMPSKLPFEGEADCSIIYVRANMGVVLTRFEISPKKSRGYSIELKDSTRKIYIETSDATAISEGWAESSLAENYKGQKIEYLLTENETGNHLTILFDINGKTYYISAEYGKDASDTLKSDIDFLLDQMIK